MLPTLRALLCLSILIRCCESAVDEVEVTIESDKIVATVNDSFHGVALDASLFTPKGLYSFVDIKSPKLVALLKGLSPGYFRVGGTFANWLFFDMKDKEAGSWEQWPFKNATEENKGKTRGWLFRPPNDLNESTFDALVTLTKESNMRLLFDLNAEIRHKDGTWDSSQAEKLFTYCKSKNYGDNIDWELGNEPNHISAHNLTEKQVGEDFLKLHKLLQNFPTLNKGSLVGPDVGWMGVSYIRGLANVSGEHLTAFTIHQYYFDGKTATVDTYLNASIFENLQKLFDRVKDVLKGSTYADKPIWIGETSSGYNSGTKDVSDTYVSGFLYLDKLGLSALNNVKVVVRQTIYNGEYGLLNKTTLDPFPDYWLMYVHNNLVGNKVFKVNLNKNLTNTVRVYAQCTKIQKEQSNVAEKYSAGALTVFALNVGSNSVTLKIKNPFNSQKIDAYVLTPKNDNITSRDVQLNGNLLKMESDNKLPILKREQQNSITLEPKTFGFFVIPDANVNDCM